MASETQIQTILKDHLNLIQPGLKLVDINVPVPNAHGSYGKLDILARDTEGYHVIIELKVNRKSSREGMQELAKYIHIYVAQNGISRARIRTVMLSTDWHELIAPFTELKPLWPCDLTGYRFEISSDGYPVNFEIVAPLPFVPHIDISPYHLIVLAKSDQAVEQKLKSVNATMEAIGLLDYVVFIFQREHLFVSGKTEYLLYFLIQTIQNSLVDAIARAMHTTIEPDGTPTKFGRWEYAVWSLLTNGHMRDEFESGNPSALVKMVSKYKFIKTYKYGRFDCVLGAWTDEDLLLESIRCAYADRESDQPPPRNLLEIAQQIHRWDADL